ncbi:MAG: hypothetical protein PUB21_08070 [Bacteroidales bacterium]|nr:hypothetical protein [Bacteroidales bacterium]
MDRLDLYDNMPSGMREYLSAYGWHFSKKLCEYAVSKMKKKDASGNEKAIDAYSREQVQQLLKQHGVTLENDVAYDACYVANMCKADYLGSSIPNEQYLAKFVKDFLDDPDGAKTKALDHYFADCLAKGKPLMWEDYL